jgi:hypothetical protein
VLADRTARGLVAAVALVSIAGLVVELGGYRLGWPDGPVELFGLSYEGNVPTWAASALLVLAAALLVASAERAATDRAAWWALAGVFAFLSLDEAIEIHEHLGGLVPGSGVLFFSWVIPGAAFVGVVALAFARFLLRLPAPHRRRFVLAGGLYVSGALLLELPLGWWTEREGDDNLTYGLLDWLEESLELAGSTVFVLALRARLAEP